MGKSTTATTDVGTLDQWRAKASVFSEIMEDDDQHYWTGFADALQMIHDGVITIE